MNNYSGTKCPYCGYKSFEIVGDTPTSSCTKLSYIRCSDINCKKLICALPHDSIDKFMSEIKKDIKDIKSRLGL